MTSKFHIQGDVPASLRALFDRLEPVAASGAGWKARCPAHADKNPSLSINLATDGRILLHCFAGCTAEQVVGAIDMSMRDLMGDGPAPLVAGIPDRIWPTRDAAAKGVAAQTRGTVQAIYDYPDQFNSVWYAVVRIMREGGKTFRPLTLNGEEWRIGDPRNRLLPLFRLPQLLPAHDILVVEGEKCVLQAEALGLVATTSAHGANSAKKTDWTFLANKWITIWPDNDESGRTYARDVGCILRTVDPEIRINHIKVDGLPEGGDICDWHDNLVAKGLSTELIAAELRRLVEAARRHLEADSTYSAYSTGPTPSSGAWLDPKPLPDGDVAPPFPIDAAFPPACLKLREFVEAVAESYQVPVDLPALLALAALGLVSARSYEVEAQRDWREVLAIYVLILLPSGERKSAAFARMIGPIYEWQQHQASRLAKGLNSFVNDVAVLKERIRRGRRKAASDELDEDGASNAGLADLTRELVELERTEPKPPSMIASEATTEAIADMLVENQERGLLASPEGDAIDVMLGRYGQGRPNFGLWLSGHAGDAITIRRKGRPPLSLRRPVLCVAMTIQPTAAEDLLQSRQADGRGVLARFLYSIPKPRVGFRALTPSPVPTPLIDWYGTRIHQLLDTPVPQEPQLLKPTVEAGDLLLLFRERVEVQLRLGGDLAERRAWGSKLPGAILRIAGVLHVAGNAGFGSGMIDVATMKAALSWAAYLTAHEELVMSTGADNQSVSIAKRILSWITRKNRTEFSDNDAFNAVRGSTVQKASDVIAPLDLLVDHGWIRPLPPKPRPPSTAGRPPSPRYEVHPGVHRNSGKAPQNTHNTQNPGDDLGGDHRG